MLQPGNFFNTCVSRIILRGDLFAHHLKYEDAIKDYSLVVARDSSPIGLEKRAAVYILTKQHAKAIKDLKRAAEMNSDYWYSIGYTIELTNQLDSAIIYYDRYLRFTEDKKLRLHVDSLIEENRK